MELKCRAAPGLASPQLVCQTAFASHSPDTRWHTLQICLPDLSVSHTVTLSHIFSRSLLISDSLALTLFSHSSHTLLTLFSHSSHALLTLFTLFSHSSHTLLTLFSLFSHTTLSPALTLTVVTRPCLGHRAASWSWLLSSANLSSSVASSAFINCFSSSAFWMSPASSACKQS